MSKIDTKILEDLIERSILLTQRHKMELKTILPTMSGVRLTKLKGVLDSEGEVIDKMMRDAVDRAVEEDDIKFLSRLEQMLSKSLKSLHKEQEKMDAEDEEEIDLDNFFEDIDYE